MAFLLSAIAIAYTDRLLSAAETPCDLNLRSAAPDPQSSPSRTDIQRGRRPAQRAFFHSRTTPPQRRDERTAKHADLQRGAVGFIASLEREVPDERLS
jgi:hypothetical protein